MPTAPLRACLVPGCPQFAGPRGRCLEHDREKERQRGTARERGYSRRWERFAEHIKRHYPLCGMRPSGQPPVMSLCHETGRITAGDHVDHVVPHRGDQQLFWDWANIQVLCASCHSRKTKAGL